MNSNSKAFEYAVTDMPWMDALGPDKDDFVTRNRDEAITEAKKVFQEKKFARVWYRRGNCVVASRWMPLQDYGEHYSTKLGRDYRRPV